MEATNAAMETNTVKKKPNAAAMNAMMTRPVTGQPAPNSDIFFFVNAAFRQEFEVCARLTPDHVSVSFDADLVQKLNVEATTTYSTLLRVPKGCIVRAQVHPVFRRLLVQSMWLQQQPAMLRYKGKGQAIDPKAPVCICANPPCQKSAVRFVGNPGFFLQKSLLLDPFCVPVCGDPKCVQQAQQMSATIHAQAQQPPPQGPINPALKAQMPNSVKSCHTCGSFEQKYGGTAVMLRGCPLCGLAVYCSQQCQIQDWQKGHQEICTNAKGTANKAALAAKQPEKKKAPQQPTTIPEEGDESKPEAKAAAPAPAPAPAPMPLPVRGAPAPAPAPMPIRKAAPTQKAPPNNTPVQELTQAMAAIPMPTYKMPEELAPKQAPATAPSMAVPTYKMPEPLAPNAAAMAFAAPTYNRNVGNTAQPKQEPATSAPTIEAATGSAPVKKGRKKAE